MKKFLITLLFVFSTLLLFRNFGYQFYKIPAGSMQPALLIGDVIAANKWIYRFEEPRRGDLILFDYPQDDSQVYVKRLIGLPGETVEIKNLRVYINGALLEEPYSIEPEKIKTKTTKIKGNHFGPVTLPHDHYFVLGDNREQSEDSRHFGFVPREKIFAKADRIVGSTDGNGNKRTSRIWKAFPAVRFSNQN